MWVVDGSGRLLALPVKDKKSSNVLFVDALFLGMLFVVAVKKNGNNKLLNKMPPYNLLSSLELRLKLFKF